MSFTLLVAMPAVAPSEPAPSRIEARSADLLAVGIANDGHMSIHLSQPLDNAPVRDAVLTILLRGVVHTTVAEADGSYMLQSKDLNLPGPAAVEFQVIRAGKREHLEGMLMAAGGQSSREDKNGARQLGWWILNFTVCIGFLMLMSRRRKTTAKANATSHD